MTTRIAVFASGSGSNLSAILDHFARPRAAEVGEVVLVASENRTAGALARAAGRGVATAVIADPKDGGEIGALLRENGVDLVALAGYLKLVPSAVIAGLSGRVLNVHPALLPAFGGPGMYGARVHKAVLASGAKVTGATIHAVTDEYDSGPIIAQWPVPVYPSDTPASLGARVLHVEHLLYPRVLEVAAASGVEDLASASRREGADVAPPDAAFSLEHIAPEPLALVIEAAMESWFGPRREPAKPHD